MLNKYVVINSTLQNNSVISLSSLYCSCYIATYCSYGFTVHGFTVLLNFVSNPKTRRNRLNINTFYCFQTPFFKTLILKVYPIYFTLVFPLYLFYIITSSSIPPWFAESICINCSKSINSKSPNAHMRIMLVVTFGMRCWTLTYHSYSNR